MKQLLIKCMLIAFSALGCTYADAKEDIKNEIKEIGLEECRKIIDNSIFVLNKAIKAGGSTIRSYHSGNNVDGKFQRIAF